MKRYRVYNYGNPLRVWIALGPINLKPDSILKLRDAHGFTTECFASEVSF